MSNRTVPRFKSGISDSNRVAIDGLCIAGDLTKNGHAEAFQLARELLPLLDVASISVPGNRDVPGAGEDRPPVEGFEQPFGPGPYPVARCIRSVDVMAIDTASHPSDRDGWDRWHRHSSRTVTRGERTRDRGEPAGAPPP